MVAGKTIYCVQTYSGGKREFIKGPLRRFATEEGALSAAGELARRAPGVVAFKVSGAEEFDCWGEPVVIAKHGRTPRLGR